MVIALIAVRQVLVRDVIRTAVESRLSAIVGRQVTIGRLDFTLFPRLSVTGRDVRFGGAGAVAPALEIGSVRLVPRVSTLFSTPIVIDRVDLDGFTVSALREGGSWQVPSVVPSSRASGPAAVDVERVRLNGARIRVFDRAPNGAISETPSIDDIDADVPVLDRAAESLVAIEDPVGSGRPAGWSLDSRTVYLLLDTDGFRCLWGQRIDASGRLEGKPTPVRHFHGAEWAALSTSFGNPITADGFLIRR